MKARPGRPRDPDVETAILRAALDLFVEVGVHGTSIEQVAKRAGVGKASVYRRWRSKEELLAQAIESTRQDIREPSPDELAAVPVAEVVERTIPSIAEAIVDPRFRVVVAHVIGSSTTYPALMQAYWERFVEPRRASARLFLRHAQEEGRVAPDADLDTLMDMLVGAVLVRLARPGQLDVATMRAFLRSLYRQVGLL